MIVFFGGFVREDFLVTEHFVRDDEMAKQCVLKPLQDSQGNLVVEVRRLAIEAKQEVLVDPIKSKERYCSEWVKQGETS